MNFIYIILYNFLIFVTKIQLIPRLLSTIHRSPTSPIVLPSRPLTPKNTFSLSMCLDVGESDKSFEDYPEGGGGRGGERRGQSWPVTRAYWPRRGAGIMTTRVRTGEKIYRGLFLELSPSVSFETAGHHDPDHVQSAGGREKEGFGRVGEVGERERQATARGWEIGDDPTSGSFSGGEEDRIGY